MRVRRIAFVVTHAITARVLLRGQLQFLRSHGFEPVVIADPGPDLDAVRERDAVETFAVRMSRSVRLYEGPRALFELGRVLAQVQPHVVNASTPKGGLLGTLAASAVRVPARVYLVRGTLAETSRGLRRHALRAAERAACGAATDVVCVSESLRSWFVETSLVPARKVAVIPSNGVDLERFRPRAATASLRAEVRSRLGIPPGVPVVGFVGRLHADKGLDDVVTVVERVRDAGLDCAFLVVGGDAAGDTLATSVERRLRALPRLHFTGYVAEPAPYYAAMDVLLFPSYREGLPNVPLEAGACEVPTAGYRVTGVRDAVDDGVTGTLVDAGDRRALGDALVRLLRDEASRTTMGQMARARVETHFEQRATWARWLELYERAAARSVP